jgi:hypothetical protein
VIRRQWRGPATSKQVARPQNLPFHAPFNDALRRHADGGRADVIHVTDRSPAAGDQVST